MTATPADAERYFTAAERRAVLRRRSADKAAIQRNIEDDFIWEYVDIGGDEW